MVLLLHQLPAHDDSKDHYREPDPDASYTKLSLSFLFPAAHQKKPPARAEKKHSRPLSPAPRSSCTDKAQN